MTVYVYPADVEGCGHYRLIWPAEVLRSQGHDVRIVLPQDRNGIVANINPHTGVMESVTVPQDATAMVLQRTTHKHLVQMVEMVTRSGIAVIIDVDDDLSRIDPQHGAFKSLHPKHNDTHNWLNVQKACELATMVTVSTPALLNRYARHGRGAVVRNCVPENYFSIEHFDSAVVGWGGVVATHPNDLQVMGGMFQRIARDYNAEIMFVGPPNGVTTVTGLTDDQFIATGSLPLDIWPARLSELGIGLAPLRDTQFNHAKSELKPLEMASLGVPCIMSDVTEYRWIHKRGVGLLAKSPSHWFPLVKRLIRSESMRRELSASGRAAVRDRTYEKQAWRWMEVWTEATKMVKKMRDTQQLTRRIFHNS